MMETIRAIVIITIDTLLLAAIVFVWNAVHPEGTMTAVIILTIYAAIAVTLYAVVANGEERRA